MLTATELAQCRTLQELAMVDVCEIRVPGGTPGPFDPETGTSPSVPHEPHYTGICRAQADSNAARDMLVADQTVTTRLYAVAIPWTVVDVQVDQIVTITDSADPRLVDRELRVKDIEGSTFATARRLICIDNLG